MEKILFYHGGPGLNSNPERNMLTALYKDMGLELITWDEPSCLRGTLNSNASGSRFEQLLQSAEAFLSAHYNDTPVCLMGSSLGCQVVCRLLEQNPDKVKIVIFSGPCFHLYKTDQRIFNLLAMDFAHHGDPGPAEAMKTILKNFTAGFDENNAQGWRLALSNPRLFEYYWTNREQQQQFLSFFSAPAYNVDAGSFFEVRASLTEKEPAISDKRALLFYGAKDRVIDSQEELATVKSSFTKLQAYKMEQSAHYPHIEQAIAVANNIASSII